MIAALVQYDLEAGRRWLSFPRPPPLPIRRALMGNGWRYHGGLRAWHNDDPTAAIPEGFAVGQGGSCNYSTVRPYRGSAILELLARTRTQIAARAPTHPGSLPL